MTLFTTTSTNITLISISRGLAHDTQIDHLRVNTSCNEWISVSGNISHVAKVGWRITPLWHLATYFCECSQLCGEVQRLPVTLKTIRLEIIIPCPQYQHYISLQTWKHIQQDDSRSWHSPKWIQVAQTQDTEGHRCTLGGGHRRLNGQYFLQMLLWDFAIYYKGMGESVRVLYGGG